MKNKVYVSTSQFEFSHSRKPKGWGHWAFVIAGKVEFIPGSCNYGEAVKKAKQIAAERNVSHIEVAP